MKNCGVPVALAVLLALTAYNMWTVQTLRGEIHALREEVRRQQHSSSLMAEALKALQQARDAIGKTDTAAARGALERARDAVDEAIRSAERAAAPAAQWLQERVRDLSKQLHENAGTKP